MRQILAEVYKHVDMQGKMSWIFKSVADELLDIMTEDALESDVAEYLLITSQVMRWVATGEIDDLPDMFKDHVQELEAPQALALPAGDAMIAHQRTNAS